MPNVRDLPEIESLIPHRPPMRFIDRVLDVTESHITAAGSIKNSFPLSDDAGADMILSIEMIAQAVAAFHHQKKGRVGGPQIDFLVGIKEAFFFVERLPLNDEIIIHVEMISHIGNYGIFKGDVVGDGKKLCRAVVQVFEPGEDFWESIVNERMRGLLVDA